MVAQKVLSNKEIKELIKNIRKVFTFIRELKKENKIASKINNPKIPSSLSESLSIHLLKKGLIPEIKDYNFQLGGNVADIIGKLDKSEIKIEVKATGKGAFQNLGEKDINANYIIWIHFEDYFEKEVERKIDIYIGEKLKENKIILNQTKINLEKIKEHLIKKQISI